MNILFSSKHIAAGEVELATKFLKKSNMCGQVTYFWLEPFSVFFFLSHKAVLIIKRALCTVSHESNPGRLKKEASFPTTLLSV